MKQNFSEDSEIIFSNNIIDNKYKITLILINLNLKKVKELLKKVIEFKYNNNIPKKKLKLILPEFSNCFKITNLECNKEILVDLPDLSVDKFHYIKMKNFVGLYQLKVFSEIKKEIKEKIKETYSKIKSKNLKILNPNFEIPRQMVELGKENNPIEEVSKNNSDNKKKKILLLQKVGYEQKKDQ